MLDTRIFARLLAERCSVITGVPDSLLKNLSVCLKDTAQEGCFWITVNEGSSVAMACGAYMATGKPGVVFMQNSGLGHALNPLLSLCDPLVYGIPLLCIIGLRGEIGKKDEPQHRKMGLVTEQLLHAAGIPYSFLPDDITGAENAIKESFLTMQTQHVPVALLVRKGLFAPYAGTPADADARVLPAREEALGATLAVLPPAIRIVATTGMLSRELFEYREKKAESHGSDFLTVGAMGHASQIALGLAVNLPEQKIICLDGDGALLMHMGGMATIGTAGVKNFIHIVFNNGAHDSVGGQPTVARKIDLVRIAASCGYTESATVDSTQNIQKQLAAWLCREGCFFLEILVDKGARKDLGRPTLPLPDCLNSFAKNCRHNEIG